MLFKNFRNEMERKLKERLGAGVEIWPCETTKNNGVIRTGISIKTEGINMAPTIYLEEFFCRYLDGENMDHLVTAIEQLYYKVKLEQCDAFESIFEFENIKDRIVYKLVNQVENEKFLTEVPFLPFYDLAILPYVIIESKEMGAASMQIKKEHIEMWNVTEKEIFELARKNTPQILPPELIQLHGFFYILTNTRKMWGASAILYPEILEKVYDIIGEEYYLLPSSVHEFIFMPKSFEIDKEHIRSTVEEINHIEVEDYEILSNNIYYYSHECKKIMMV